MVGVARASLLVDLDGTVWDSTPWYEELIGGGSFGNDRVPVATALRNAGITKARFRQLALQHASSLLLFEDVAPVLERLRKLGVRTGAVTNLPGWMAGPMLEAQGLQQHLDVVVDFGQTKAHKPKPAPLLRALEIAEVRPSARSWYVGDTASDLRAANAAGLSFAWAGYSTSPDPEASVVLEAFSEIEGCFA